MDIQVTDKSSNKSSIKAEPFHKHKRVTAPHKHNQYFEIVFLSKGAGYHRIDGKTYEVKPPVLFFINKDQVHNWELTDEPDGYVIILKPSYLEECRDEALKHLLFILWNANCFYVEDGAELTTLCQLLNNNLGKPSPYSKHATDGLLKTILVRVIEAGVPQLVHSGRHAFLYTRFLNLLIAQPAVMRKVGYYAEQLNTSTQNLNASCRNAVGRTAGELVDTFVMAEAERLLLYTDKHVSEIAYSLDFRDPSYFVKFFKKHVTETPEAFRRSAFQNRQQ